jgi:hypothetical protein
MSSTERVAVAALLVGALLASGCMIGRRYVGSEIRGDAHEVIQIGRTTRPEVLAAFGPPDRIVRQREGDVFVYRYDQRNQTQLTIEEPVVTNFEIFSYEKVQEKSDLLMVFFDRAGVVTAFGYRHGREELEPL